MDIRRDKINIEQPFAAELESKPDYGAEPMISGKVIRDFAIELYHIWITERPNQLAAALAYFSMFSFAPVIFLAYSIAGIFIDQISAANRMYARLESVLGPEVTTLVKEMVSTLSHTAREGSFLASLVSLVALLFAASGLFYQLQFALNKIWQAPAPQKGQTLAVIRQRLFSFLMLIGLGLILILAAVLNLITSSFGQILDEFFGLGVVPPALSLIAMLGLFTLSFALIYKILPDARIAWTDVWLGSFITAALFIIAAYILGYFLRIGGIGSAFEAAGSFAILLIGINYGAQIFLFGAVFIRVYAHRFGSLRPVQQP